MVRRRGFILILSLLLVAIFLILALGIATSRSRQYDAAERQVASQAALQLALAGLEDARVKLNKDLFFPPIENTEQGQFSYVETVIDLDQVTAMGLFEVTIDVSKREAPYYVITVSSIGTVGQADRPISRRQVAAELDVAPDLVAGVRGQDDDRSSYTNPEYWTFVGFRDLGSY